MRSILITATLLVATVAAVAATPRPSSDAPSTDAKRCVLITGANRGLGLEFATQYAAEGWHVIGTARRPDAATELRETGADVVALDVADAESITRLVAELDGRPIDLLINNAGISGRGRSIADLDMDRMEAVMAVNLLGPMRVTSALLPNLRAGDGKMVVSISSQLGSIERNTGGGYYGYRESKAGVNMFMRTLAAELRPEGFTCVAMSPGWVRTDMGGDSAPLSPEESITGMRTVIAGLTPEGTGRFLNYAGEELPW